MTSLGFEKTAAAMGTLVTFRVPGHEPSPAVDAAVERALSWFQRIESCCSRFDPQSELMRLCAHLGVAVPVSPILYESVQFALAVAEESEGAFDPTVGRAMESFGFNSDYLSGVEIHSGLPSEDHVSYRDVILDPEEHTVTLLQPMTLDLGSVVKGLAIDMAVRELQPFTNFSVDAGGDLYLGGRNPEGEPWSVGIRHPRLENELIDCIRVSDRAVCTSGDYERRAPNDAGFHHILDPRTASPVTAIASATVVAPTALMADALATAAFVLGPASGISLLDRMGVEGLLVSPALERFATKGMVYA